MLLQLLSCETLLLLFEAEFLISIRSYGGASRSTALQLIKAFPLDWFADLSWIEGLVFSSFMSFLTPYLWFTKFSLFGNKILDPGFCFDMPLRIAGFNLVFTPHSNGLSGSLCFEFAALIWPYRYWCLDKSIMYLSFVRSSSLSIFFPKDLTSQEIWWVTFKPSRSYVICSIPRFFEFPDSTCWESCLCVCIIVISMKVLRINYDYI